MNKTELLRDSDGRICESLSIPPDDFLSASGTLTVSLDREAPFVCRPTRPHGFPPPPPQSDGRILGAAKGWYTRCCYIVAMAARYSACWLVIRSVWHGEEIQMVSPSPLSVSGRVALGAPGRQESMAGTCFLVSGVHCPERHHSTLPGPQYPTVRILSPCQPLRWSGDLERLCDSRQGRP